MMYKRKDQAESLCVLRVSRSVLNLDNVVLADQNASSDYVRFLSPAQIRHINLDQVYALDWRHQGDQIAYFRHKATKCAEVLVPNVVAPELIVGAYVVNARARNALLATGFSQEIQINAQLFFH
jgi:hypothetical protein